MFKNLIKSFGLEQRKDLRVYMNDVVIFNEYKSSSNEIQSLENENWSKIVDQFSDLFEGIGKNERIFHSISLTSDKIIRHKIQQIPIHWKVQLKEHIKELKEMKQVFNILRKEKLRLNKEKCEFGKSVIEYLGFKIDSGKRSIISVNKEKILKFSRPSNQQEAKTDLIENFSKLALPLYECSNQRKFVWKEEQEKSFMDIKKIIEKDPSVKIPDPNIPFIRDCSSKLGRMVLKLQEFQIENIDYIKGSDNVLADALSRLQMNLLSSDAEDELDDVIEKDKANFIKKDGRWFFVDKSREREILRLYVKNENERRNILKVVHENGHLGLFKNEEELRRRFWWPFWRKELKAFIKNCSRCEFFKNDDEKTKLPMVPSVLEPLNWCKVGLDFCGPLQVSEAGNKFVILIQDYASKFLLAEAFEDVSDLARKRILENEAAQMKQKCYYDRKIKLEPLFSGDLVLWHQWDHSVGSSKKLNKKWRGPFVIKNRSVTNYEIADKNGNSRWIHHNHLKRFNGDSATPLDTIRNRGRPAHRS
ncbi:hypothetical protein HUG17_3772 [Dermatophagoides farinae]|uniref:RNA-directed DNA polymerase n=1 Tax=Dermatophagoides farinae TaxID=6954 RepID=A0A9D4NX82_DERFA|nr:hypothetical protein HUG17_3772 [Dermatophagoides farinae]